MLRAFLTDITKKRLVLDFGTPLYKTPDIDNLITKLHFRSLLTPKITALALTFAKNNKTKDKTIKIIRK